MDEIGEKLDALLNDPKQFGKIAQLASSILGDGGDKSAPPSAPEPDLDLDMGQLRRMMSALRGSGHDSANRHLLEAMKPYLAEKRRRKIDRAMKLARLASLAELAAAHAVQRQVRKRLFQPLRVALAVAEVEHGVRLLLPDGAHHAERPAVRIGKNKDLRGKSPPHCS